jgi:hypothetical protein
MLTTECTERIKAGERDVAEKIFFNFAALILFPGLFDFSLSDLCG